MKPAIMVMGVSGCGKSTIGTALADALGGVFLDGDDYHPQSNVDHMTAGQPLTDAMRQPWLDKLAAAVIQCRQDQATVFACSALKRTYRDRLRATIPDLMVVYLDAPRDVVTRRLSMRHDHFMPETLLDSQYDTLDVPVRPTAFVSIDQPVKAIVAEITDALNVV